MLPLSLSHLPDVAAGGNWNEDSRENGLHPSLSCRSQRWRGRRPPPTLASLGPMRALSIHLLHIVKDFTDLKKFV